MKEQFQALPRPLTEEGIERRVGVEMEMAGLSLEAIAGAVSDRFGGVTRRESVFHYRVLDTALGDFSVELDASVLKSRRYRALLAELGIDLNEKAYESLDRTLSDLAGLVVPNELVAPPIPFSQLHRLDELRSDLCRAGAQGTHGSVVYAFGLQLNAEVATIDSEWLVRMIRAFLVLHDQLIAWERVDVARKLTPFISGFPGRYVRQVLHPGYRPDAGQLIDDYLALNSTRNRPLDMLPLFAWMDEDKVARAPVEHQLVKPRPTFHYRLPNCQIDDPGWDLSLSWNNWVRIEQLAEDPAELDCLAGLIRSRWGQRLKGVSDQVRDRLERFYS